MTSTKLSEASDFAATALSAGNMNVETVSSVEGEQEAGQRIVASNPRFKWYIVNTYTGSEETVKVTLAERIERAGMQKFFGEIFIPKIVVEKVLKSGKKKLVDKTTYPGYVLVQMDLNDDTMGCVTSTPKVTGFVGNRRSPRPMPDREVMRLLNPEAGQLAAQEKAAQVAFSKGDSVKVTDGPFTNFDGVIEEVRPDKMKVKVLVSIFGRETPVELSFSQIKKL